MAVVLLLLLEIASSVHNAEITISAINVKRPASILLLMPCSKLKVCLHPLPRLDLQCMRILYVMVAIHLLSSVIATSVLNAEISISVPLVKQLVNIPRRMLSSKSRYRIMGCVEVITGGEEEGQADIMDLSTVHIMDLIMALSIMGLTLEVISEDMAHVEVVMEMVDGEQKGMWRTRTDLKLPSLEM
jgi:hypothetical protein